jgi:hypothetical protein
MEREPKIVKCEVCNWFVGYVGETLCTTCRIEKIKADKKKIKTS